MNLGLKSPSEIKNFHLLSATSSKINFFQEKCLQFTSYNNLKRFRALQTVFEDMTLVLPCPNKAFFTQNIGISAYIPPPALVFFVH